MRRVVGIIAVLIVFCAACAQDEPDAQGTDEEVSVSFGDVPETVEGNVASLDVDVTGIEIVAADGDTSGETGHLHYFIDKPPVEAGETIPREAGVVHSPDIPTSLYGLSTGEHEITVVLGDGAHKRIGDASDTTTIEVEGPSVDGSAPATIDEGEDLEVELEAEGVEIVPADGEASGDTGHLHVLVDPEGEPREGETVPAAEEGKIYHSAEDSVMIEGLDKGEHTLWIVLGNGRHEIWDPLVLDKLTVTVG